MKGGLLNRENMKNFWRSEVSTRGSTKSSSRERAMPRGHCRGDDMSDQIQAIKVRGRVPQNQAPGPQPGRAGVCAVWIIVSLLLLTIPMVAKDKRQSRLDADHRNSNAVLWSNPSDIASRDLFYGPGGKGHEPHTTYTFIKEDPNGSNPN